MSELMDKAVKEGISISDTDQTVDAIKDTSSVSKQETTDKTQTTETGTTGATSAQKSTENVPFDQHPRFKALYKQNKESERRLAELEKKYQDQLEKISQNLSQRNTPQAQVSQEQRQQEEALLQLVDLIKSNPNAMERLGLSGVSSKAEALEQQLESLQEERTMNEFNSEFDQMLEVAKKSGLNADEVKEEMAEYIDSHPVLSQMSYTKGAVMMAFRDKYWDKMGELKEREQNLKLINERDKKKAANSETASAPSTGSKSLPGALKEHMEDLIREGGGISI